MTNLSPRLVALIFALLTNLSDRSLKTKTLVNAALAFLSTYTFANGMLLWLLAFPLKTAPVDRAGAARNGLFGESIYLLIAVASLSAISFPTDIHRSLRRCVPARAAYPTPPLFIGLARFVVRVGAPAICGAIVLLLFLGLAAAAISQIRRTGAWRAHYPWLVLGCYTLISGGVVAVGRLGFNYSMAADVRYTVSTAFIYIAIVGLGFSVFTQAKPRPRTKRILLAAAIASLVVVGAFWAITFEKERRLLPILTQPAATSCCVLRWSEAIPRNPEIAHSRPTRSRKMCSAPFALWPRTTCFDPAS